jgi:hypothetical protein
MFLLWPAQMVAVIEATVGSAVAVVIALATNVLLFALIGLIVAFVSHARGYTIAYTVLAFLIGMLAIWGAGFSFVYLSWAALATALLIYGTLVYVASRVSSRH